jgi:hypothetical protein
VVPPPVEVEANWGYGVVSVLHWVEFIGDHSSLGKVFRYILPGKVVLVVFLLIFSEKIV